MTTRGQVLFAPLPLRNGRRSITVLFNPAREEPELPDILAELGWMPPGSALAPSSTWKIEFATDVTSITYAGRPGEPFYTCPTDRAVLDLAVRQPTVRAVFLAHNPERTTLATTGLGGYVRQHAQLQILLPVHLAVAGALKSTPA